MPTIQLNGTAIEIGEQTPLTALLKDRGIQEGQPGVAVALNGKVVPRARWAEVTLSAGDQLEIVHARQGG